MCFKIEFFARKLRQETSVKIDGFSKKSFFFFSVWWKTVIEWFVIENYLCAAWFTDCVFSSSSCGFLFFFFSVDDFMNSLRRYIRRIVLLLLVFILLLWRIQHTHTHTQQQQQLLAVIQVYSLVLLSMSSRPVGLGYRATGGTKSPWPTTAHKKSENSKTSSHNIK